jgi:hypothetical protein
LTTSKADIFTDLQRAMSLQGDFRRVILKAASSLLIGERHQKTSAKRSAAHARFFDVQVHRRDQFA